MVKERVVKASEDGVWVPERETHFVIVVGVGVFVLEREFKAK